MEAIEIQTGSKPAASIIWLHGLGADGHDFEPIVPELKLAKPVRFVFPHAPVRPVTINQGMRMRAWYDILQFGGGPEDGTELELPKLDSRQSRVRDDYGRREDRGNRDGRGESATHPRIVRPPRPLRPT